jgi:TM2 domain-containing membrane protein YozV
MAEKQKNSGPMPLAALVLAWLIPGAGHVYIGRVRRGIIIFVAVTATFWSGVALGGVMTVDSRNERWWFTAQMLTGINGVIGWHRQNSVYNQVAQDIGPLAPPRTADAVEQLPQVDQALAARDVAVRPPVDTVARAYSGVAGLMNLLCVFDAVMLALMGIRGEKPLPKPREASA